MHGAGSPVRRRRGARLFTGVAPAGIQRAVRMVISTAPHDGCVDAAQSLPLRGGSWHVLHFAIIDGSSSTMPSVVQPGLSGPRAEDHHSCIERKLNLSTLRADPLAVAEGRAAVTSRRIARL